MDYLEFINKYKDKKIKKLKNLIRQKIKLIIKILKLILGVIKNEFSKSKNT